ncbi:MAG: hypothetical protein EZS28_018830 [Streblomastix strix]|uniref:Uncharacterized protein n=1 Tax=Streblomastix strix TaxID=222440 RepID=A0A5J4VTL1_9EUKA|nr:MAG: hypothetical protein EZS28_018830 [Streblomastix strix]
MFAIKQLELKVKTGNVIVGNQDIKFNEGDQTADIADNEERLLIDGELIQFVRVEVIGIEDDYPTGDFVQIKDQLNQAWQVIITDLVIITAVIISAIVIITIRSASISISSTAIIVAALRKR